MIGIDIVKISRIQEALKNKNFAPRIMTAGEIEYAFSKSKELTKFGFTSVDMTVAGLFAAKEAVLKALMVGMHAGYGFKDVEVEHEASGAPKVNLSKKLAAVLKKLGMNEVCVSIAHDGEYAVANAVLK